MYAMGAGQARQRDLRSRFCCHVLLVSYDAVSGQASLRYTELYTDQYSLIDYSS